VVLTVYFATMALCVSGIFIIGLGGMIVYRDMSSYTLAGNPWEPSHVPGYVIWPMRLMSIVGAMAICGIGFAVTDTVMLTVIRRFGSSVGVGHRLAGALITLLLELALAAWMMHWIGG
jgi:hypothetical protein